MTTTQDGQEYFMNLMHNNPFTNMNIKLLQYQQVEPASEYATLEDTAGETMGIDNSLWWSNMTVEQQQQFKLELDLFALEQMDADTINVPVTQIKATQIRDQPNGYNLVPNPPGGQASISQYQPRFAPPVTVGSSQSSSAPIFPNYHGSVMNPAMDSQPFMDVGEASLARLGSEASAMEYVSNQMETEYRMDDQNALVYNRLAALAQHQEPNLINEMVFVEPQTEARREPIPGGYEGMNYMSMTCTGASEGPWQMVSMPSEDRASNFTLETPSSPDSAVLVVPRVCSNSLSKRKRGGKAPARLNKESTQEVRRVGACLPCKEQKSRCKPTVPCKRCLQMAFMDPAIATRLCTRGVKASSFRKELGDILWVDASVDEKIRKAIPVLTQDPRVITVVKDTKVVEQLFCERVPPIRLQIHSYDDYMYMIDPEAMPSARDLVQNVYHYILPRYHAYPDNVEAVMDAFLLSVAWSNVDKACKRLAADVLQIALLHTWVRRRTLFDPESTGSSSSVMDEEAANWITGVIQSNIVRLQFSVLAARKIEELEAQSLKKIDELLPGTTTPSSDCAAERERLILGICIRRLALYYRFIMGRYRTAKQHPAIGRLYEKALRMYDTMTLRYAQVFSRVPLLSMELEAQENDAELHRIFQDQRELVAGFKTLRDAEFHHMNKEMYPDGDDGVYLSSVVEKKDKKGRTLKERALLSSRFRVKPDFGSPRRWPLAK